MTPFFPQGLGSLDIVEWVTIQEENGISLTSSDIEFLQEHAVTITSANLPGSEAHRKVRILARDGEKVLFHGTDGSTFGFGYLDPS